MIKVSIYDHEAKYLLSMEFPRVPVKNEVIDTGERIASVLKILFTSDFPCIMLDKPLSSEDTSLITAKFYRLSRYE